MLARARPPLEPIDARARATGRVSSSSSAELERHFTTRSAWSWPTLEATCVQASILSGWPTSECRPVCYVVATTTKTTTTTSTSKKHVEALRARKTRLCGADLPALLPPPLLLRSCVDRRLAGNWRTSGNETRARARAHAKEKSLKLISQLIDSRALARERAEQSKAKQSGKMLRNTQAAKWTKRLARATNRARALAPIAR